MPQKQIKQHIKARADVVKAEAKGFGKSLARIYSRVITSTTRGINRDNYLTRLGSVIEALKDAGLEKELTQLKALYAKQYKEAQALYETNMANALGTNNKKGDAVFALPKAEVEQLILSRTNTIEANVFAQVQELQDVIAGQVLTGQVDTDLLEEIADDNGANADTLLRTGLDTFQRSVSMGMAANAGLELFLYVGPEDGSNRDFCAELLEREPPIYTLEEIQNMDNGQGLDVATSGGGWNCRHQWVPLDEETALEMGWTPDGN